MVGDSRWLFFIIVITMRVIVIAVINMMVIVIAIVTVVVVFLNCHHHGDCLPCHHFDSDHHR